MFKKQYKIRNWSDYNKALVNRGSINLWFDENSLSNWHNHYLSGERGRRKLYSDMAICCSLTLRALFHLPLRAAEGFVNSLFEILNMPLKSPNYTTLSRRQKSLSVALPYQSRQDSIDIVLDSTGLKVYGEGEWKVKIHGRSKHRTWRKLHLAVNPSNHIIEASILSDNSVKDSEVIEPLLNQVESKINQVCADGGYDAKNCYYYLQERNTTATIAPRMDAIITDSSPISRDQNLITIKQVGREKWKQYSGYHKRSLAETAMFRFKRVFGNQLASRCYQNQMTEAMIKCRALNLITKIGMPITMAM